MPLQPTLRNTYDVNSWLPRLKFMVDNGKRLGAVTRVERIRMPADVVAYFDEKAPEVYTLQNIADAAPTFNLNIFVDKESFHVLYPRHYCAE
jgi:hypothetical protein